MILKISEVLEVLLDQHKLNIRDSSRLRWKKLQVKDQV